MLFILYWHVFNKNEELRMYKKNHGDTNVSTKKGSLGQWVNDQRKAYRLKNKGVKCSMTDERIKALNKLGFDWAPGHAGVKGDKSHHEAKWNRTLEGESIKFRVYCPFFANCLFLIIYKILHLHW